MKKQAERTKEAILSGLAALCIVTLIAAVLLVIEGTIK